MRRNKCILAVRKRQSMSRGIAVSYISSTPEPVGPRSFPPAPLPNKADRRSPVARRAAPQRSSGLPAHLGRANHRAAVNSRPSDAGDLRPTYARARTALAIYRGFDRGFVRRTDRAKRFFQTKLSTWYLAWLVRISDAGGLNEINALLLGFESLRLRHHWTLSIFPRRRVEPSFAFITRLI